MQLVRVNRLNSLHESQKMLFLVVGLKQKVQTGKIGYYAPVL